jgi:hypothetical protein
MISILIAGVALLYVFGGGCGLIQAWTAEMIPRAGSSWEYAMHCFTHAPATALAAQQVAFGFVLSVVAKVVGWFKL